MTQPYNVENITSESEAVTILMNFLTEAERNQILVDWNKTQTNYPKNKCIHQLFEEQVEHTPDAIAVVFENQQLTYRELNQRANQLAHHLQTLGVAPEVLVGICVERSLLMVIGILGILKAGGAYVPLDPTYPQERLAFMLEDAAVSVILTQVGLAEKLPAHFAQLVYLDKDWNDISQYSSDSTIHRVRASNLAYVIYTSGSTGKPKGVCCNHIGVVNLLADFQSRKSISSGDRCSLWTVIGFDVSVYEIFAPLLAGGSLIIPSESLRLDPKAFFGWLSTYEIFSAYIPPFMLSELASWLTHSPNKRSLQRLLVGVEPIDEQLLAEITRRVPGLLIINGYGPTEATVCTTLYEVNAQADSHRNTPIGKPLQNTQVYILNRHLQPVPIGVAGELHIGGDGLARGYLNHPELTAEKFIPNPFSTAPGARLYRTGDLARYLPDGNIEFLGRIDHQVKIRGFRIELGEVESVLTQHLAVQQAVVIVREDVPGDKRLVSYCVAQPEIVSACDLREFLQQRLPQHMIPSFFVLLDALPLTPNGKVDRKALTEIEPPKTELENLFVAPRTSIETVLAEIWAEVFGLEQVSIHDEFLALGGHSLLAAQIVGRVANTLRVDLPIADLFSAPTIAKLAERIEATQQAQSLLAPSIQIVVKDQPLPLTYGQERLWFLSQLMPDVPVYNEPFTICFPSAVDVNALERAINEMINRHKSLRTRFIAIEGKPFQVIEPHSPFCLRVIDLRYLPLEQRQPEALQIATLEAKQPFNLAADLLLRATLIQLNDDDYRLFLTVHHIIMDGVSLFNVFLPELAALYEAIVHHRPSPLSELLLQYSDFAVWQRDWLQSEVLESHLNYWKQQLSGELPQLPLPSVYPKSIHRSFRGARQCLALPKSLTDKLKALSRQEGVTLYTVLLAAFKVLLHRYTGQDDIVIGTVSAGRNKPEIEGLVGFFLNTLALRTDLSDLPSFRQLLAQVQRVTHETLAYEDLPFEQLVETLKLDRSFAQNPLLQVAFVLEPLMPSLECGWTVSQLDIHTETAKFDLTLELDERPKGIIGRFEYSTDLFDDETIARMIGHYQTLLESIVANPEQPISELPLLTESERQQLLVEWNDTQTDYPQDKCIHQLFEEQVERTPDAIAIVFENQQLTYRELNQRANQLAHHLQTLGVAPEVLVGICVERSLLMVIGILGILKAGGAYVPLDPAYPQDRLAFMLEDAAVPVLITQSVLSQKFSTSQAQIVYLDKDSNKIALQPQTSTASGTKAKNLAYIIYTSGSTGKPKGVCVPHQGVVRLVKETNYVSLSAEDVLLQAAPISFDASTFEIWGSLLNGARLVLMPAHTPSLQELAQAIQQHRVTTLWLTAGLFHLMVEHELESLSPVRQLLAGGDVLSPRHVKQVLEEQKNCRLINGYGPTENTTFTCCYSITDAAQIGESVPIGHPIANTQVYILDRHLQPAPIGVAGELHIGGDGLARGYLNRPELTAEKFIPNPFSTEPGARLYKTGDLAHYLPSGDIEFLGRIDHQVKVRGFRIELGEVEATLSQHPDVREAVVTVREDVPGDKRLVAYITSTLMPDRLPYQSGCLLKLDGNTFKLRTEDISNGGIGLVNAPAMAEHTPICLHLLLPGADEAQWFNGVVAWSRSSAAGIRLQLTASEQTLLDQGITYLLETQGLLKTWQRTIAHSLRQFLKDKLPDYMVPSAFVLMQSLPLTPNGKIDRRALPAPDRAQAQQEDHFIAPRTPTEIAVAEIWKQVLGLQTVGIYDNFFELGGHSLLAVQIISRIRAAFAIELPLSCLFESPTVAGLSEAIEFAQENHSLDQPQTLPAIVPVPRDKAIPLSSSQYDMWYMEHHTVSGGNGNSPLALRLTGVLSSAILEQSLNEIIRRHEVLRTAFPTVEDQPIQKISPSLTVPLQVIDLQNLPYGSREPEAQRIFSEVMSHRFDLATAPLIKTVLIQLSEQEHWLLILMHHIITDGWSYGVLLEELGTLYSAFSASNPSPLPELSLQYADFTIWQRNYFSEEVIAAHLPYWKQHLANFPPSLDLLPAAQVPQENTSALIHSVILPKALTGAIASFSHAHSVTPFTVFLTALNILLYKWSNQTDIVVLGTMANRTLPEIEKLLGCFISDLPLRTQLDSNQTGTSLLESLKQTVSATLTHAMPPEKVWEPFEPFEETIEVFRTANLVLVPATKWSNPHLKCEPLPLTSDHGVWNEQFCPLELYVSYPTEADQAIELFPSYSTATFTTETIDRFVNSYQAILQKLTESPETQLSEFQLSL